MNKTQLTNGKTKINYTCAETAAMIRASLKVEFPGVKFSVRSKTYSGGASINVDWTNGPTTKQVDAVVKFYEGASFDGMIDLKSYEYTMNEAGEVIHYGADYVFTNRRISDDNLILCVAQWNAENSVKMEIITETYNGRTHSYQRPVESQDWHDKSWAEREFSSTLYNTKF